MSFEGQFINLENLQDMGGEKGVFILLNHQGAIALDFTCGSILQYNLVLYQEIIMWSSHKGCGRERWHSGILKSKQGMGLASWDLNTSAW